MRAREADAWRTRLAEGDADGAWDLFIERYRPLILATVRRTLPDPEDRLDAFAHVCEALAADGLARLRRYDHGPNSRARFSTWLVTVVRNQVVDWLRRRDGRRRFKAPAALSPLQQRIFTLVFVEQRSHAEAYERLRSELAPDLRFNAFLRELAESYRAVEQDCPRGVTRYVSRPAVEFSPDDLTHLPEDRLTDTEIRARLAPILESLAADERLALRLYVVEKVPARDVARLLGWDGPKTVYNRVYRCLMHLRALLEDEGMSRDDF